MRAGSPLEIEAMPPGGFFGSALLCLLLTGCSAFSEIKKEERDLNNTYDGEWVAEVQATKSYQKYGNWIYTCNQLTLSVVLRIEDSGIELIVNQVPLPPLKEAYVSPAGNFKIALPTGFKGRTGVHSDVDRSDIETRLIVEGNLTPEGKGRGKFIIGWATSGFKGCATKLNLEKE